MSSSHASIFDFKNGSWFKKREGTVIKVNGYEFQLTRVFHESYCDYWNQWKVLFEGFNIHDLSRETVILKFRYALIPPFGSTNKFNSPRKTFYEEIDGMKACSGSGHTPEYITHEEQQQDNPEDPYPGGPVLIIVMSKVEGIELTANAAVRDAIYLSREDMRSIRQQCVDTMEYGRQRGVIGIFGPERVIYDVEAKRINFFGMSRVARPITPAEFEELKTPFTECYEYKAYLETFPDEWYENPEAKGACGYRTTSTKL